MMTLAMAVAVAVAMSVPAVYNILNLPSIIALFFHSHFFFQHTHIYKKIYIRKMFILQVGAYQKYFNFGECVY